MAAFTNVPNIILSVILIAYFRNALLLFRAKKRRCNNFFMNGYGHAVKKKYNTTNKTVEITAIEFYRSNVFGLESGINSAPFSLSQSGY